LRVRSNYSRLFFVRLAIVLLGVLAASTPLLAQTQPERFWLAGRYDRTRIVVYFDAVKFEGTLNPNSAKLAAPLAERFFDPVEIPPTYAARFSKKPAAEHFALGDQYDLILDENHIATVTLTTLVGCETDEGVGNDSYTGALATVNDVDLLFFRKDYYVLRRHEKGKDIGTESAMLAVWGRLEDEPVPFDIQTRIVTLLNDSMKTTASASERQQAESISPKFAVQSFRQADGTLRYYARAAWSSGEEHTENEKIIYALGAWIAPLPTVHILAIETRNNPYDAFESVLPSLLNVVDLGGGRTGVIVGMSGNDSSSLDLVEYRDGADLGHMRTLQSIGAGE
jgi:hypothetical protein